MAANATASSPHATAGPGSAEGIAAVLAGLTPRQTQAVTHTGGPLIVFAGPGTGKTHTITHRIGWLIRTGRAAPHQILALTFTVNAAEEMRQRLAKPDLLGRDQAGALTAGTFHSTCARILRDNAEPFGRTDGYTVYDEADAKTLLRTILNDKRRTKIHAELAACGPVPCDHAYDEIGLAKARLWNPDAYREGATDPAAPLIAALWEAFERELAISNAFTFDDLIVCAVWLLHSMPHLRGRFRRRWQWVLVDEFQDTNYAQMALVQLLAGTGGSDGGGRLTVVADDDQSLYSFQGARVENVLGFERTFPSSTRIVLDRNYRSKAEILEIAMRVIVNNRARVAKPLIAMRGAGGATPTYAFDDEEDEAEWITGRVAAALASGISPDEIQVLHPNKYISLPLQRALAEAGIPHRVLGSLGLFERKEIKTALAYLKLIANPCDQVAFGRAVRNPSRGIGAAAAQAIVEHAHHGNGNLVEACANAASVSTVRQQRQRDALTTFAAGIAAARRELDEGRSLARAVITVLTMDGGLVAHYEDVRANSPNPDLQRDADRVLTDLRSLVSAAGTYARQHEHDANLASFLEQAALLNTHEVDEQDQRITLSSMHRSKGKGAILVILHGLEEQTLPQWRALESPDPMDLEEQRRLFYVACTRAKDWLFLCWAKRRNHKPTAGASRFLFEAQPPEDTDPTAKPPAADPTDTETRRPT